MNQENKKKSENLKTLKETSLYLLENKLISSLIVIVLVLLIIFLLTKVGVIFKPIKILFDVIFIPTIFSAIFYYLFKPVSRWLEERGLNRFTSVIIVFVIIIAVLSVIIFSLVPFIRDQTVAFVSEFPDYWQNINQTFNRFFERYELFDLQEQFNTSIANLITNLMENIRNSLSNASTIISNAIGSVVNFVISLLTIPVLLYYMLKEGEKVKPAILKFIPTKNKPIVGEFLSDVNHQIELYIRGQILVAIGVGIMLSIGYSIIGLPYGIVLGLIGGILNIIPYLGTFIAIVPAFIIGLVHSPFMFLKVGIVFAIEQTVESRILSPKVLGSNLQIHPVTILVVMLFAGRFFGFFGVLIGVPLYAILKVVVQYLARFINKHTQLYEEEL